MDPSKDIYHKEIIPFLARRKKRHSPHVKEQADASSTSAATGTPSGGLGSPPPTAFRSRRASQRHHQKKEANTNLALWWGLGIVLGIYLVALAVSFFVRVSPKSAPQAKTDIPAIAEPSRVKLEDRSRAERDLNDISSSLRS